MNEAPLSLIALSEAQRVQAQQRYIIIRPALAKEVCQNGTYTLWKSYSDHLRATASSVAIHTGLNQSNLMAIVANESTLDLHVNNQKIDSISDSTYSQGEIGLEARSGGTIDENP